MAKPKVEYMMGKYQVKDEDGKVVGTYVAKYEAQDHANSLIDKWERAKSKKVVNNSFTTGAARAHERIANMAAKAGVRLENAEPYWAIVSYTGDLYIESSDMEHSFGPFKTRKEAQAKLNELKSKSKG